MKLDDFLSRIFGKVNPSTQGVVVTAAKGDGFESRRWRPGRDQPYDDLYFCVSTVRDIPRASVLSRKTEALVLSWIAILDDVGTKVDPDLIKLPPTYKLRTSNGNQQWGFKLSYPIEPGQYAALMEAIAEAGLTDAGAIRADRIMRVPGSINHKYETPFTAELIEADWDLTYSWTELAIGLGVVVGEPKAAGTRPPPLAPGQVDPLYDWLLESGRVFEGPNARGWYAISCPWRDTHSGEIDHGTDYAPGNPGGFKCLHGHCAEKTTADLRAYAVSQGAQGLDVQIQPAQLQALAAALAPLRARVEAAAPPPVARRADVAPAGLSGRLAAHIRAIEMWPGDLPDADRTPSDQVNMRQAASAVRVEFVMDLIGIDARLNVITQQIEATLDGFDEELSASDILNVLHHACIRCGMRDKEAVRTALEEVAQKAKYSPVLNWLEAAPWDGKSRIQELCNTITVQDPTMIPWRDIAVRRWLIQGIVAWKNYRLKKPEQVSMCLVLQGAQGIGKSHWFGSLLPEGWVTIGASLHLDGPNERDVVKKATRTPITELGEVDATYRKSDTAAMRNFLSTTMDIYRMAYGRTETATPRITIFGATVNPKAFLVDQTGERRFLTIGVKAVNPDHGIDMQQLWAEVATIEEQHWLTKEEEKWHARASQAHKQITELTFVLEDIEIRKEGQPDKSTWIHIGAKEILARYTIRESPKTFGELTSALATLGFEMVKIKGRRGYYLPNLNATLTTAQQAGLKLVKPTEK